MNIDLSEGESAGVKRVNDVVESWAEVGFSQPCRKQ